ncbi:tRNA acetyltransferase TAN1, partial [Hyphodiscus hymeniophilus]
MSDSKKRKEGPGDDRSRGMKRSKGGSGGKWQTPHQAAKVASRGSGRVEVGDMGIWATCARRMEGRATEELKAMFEECAERFYGLKSGADQAEDEDEDESTDDIEASIKKEVASLDDQKGLKKLFSPVHLDLECVLFFKTRAPIDPVDFVHRICKEIKGLEEVGKTVLGAQFLLSGEGAKEQMQRPQQLTPYSYAIRPTIRNHTTLKRDTVIKQVASMVGDMHKVNLTAPDRVIIVEIYQTVCGMSVIGGDWEELKRFNLAELYQSTRPPLENKAESNPQGVTTDEPPPPPSPPTDAASS